MSEVATSPALSVTENAAKRVKVLIKSEGNDQAMLRVTVSGGGCSGFQYGFSLDTEKGEDDLLFEEHGVKLVVDETSLEMLGGSQIDFVEELVGSSFTIRNPNATATCGCGTSFSV